MPPDESKYFKNIKLEKNVLRCKDNIKEKVSRIKKYFTYYERLMTDFFLGFITIFLLRYQSSNDYFCIF
jgi:hypothetical protein